MKTKYIYTVIFAFILCTNYVSSKVDSTKEQFIVNILKNPDKTIDLVRNSNFYNQYLTIFFNEKNTSYSLFEDAIIKMKEYKNCKFHIGLDTTLINYKYYYFHSILNINRIYVYFDNSDSGIRFDFAKEDDQWYICTISEILNKKKILNNSKDKLDLIDKIINDPENYYTTVVNSKFFDKDISISLFSDLKSRKKLLTDFNKNGYHIIRHAITFSINKKGIRYPSHMIILEELNDKKILFFEFSKFNDKWYLRHDTINFEYISMLFEEEEENY